MSHNYGSKFSTSFYGGALGAAIYVACISSLSIHTMSTVPIVLVIVVSGMLHALIYVGMLARLNIQPTIWSAAASATILAALLLSITLCTGPQAWSIWTFVLAAALVFLTSCFTVFFSKVRIR